MHSRNISANFRHSSGVLHFLNVVVCALLGNGRHAISRQFTISDL